MTNSSECSMIAAMPQLTQFHQLLHDQIKHEFTSSQQYIAIAVYLDAEDLPQLAKYFYKQAIEERNHAMMIIQYLLDRDLKVSIPEIGEFVKEFKDYHETLILAYEREQNVTRQFNALAQAARAENNYIGEQFLLWFLQEQVEEVANMHTLIRVSERSKGNTFDFENYVAREFPKVKNNVTAPTAAGGNI